ncbi:VOC family protein [Phycicoccus sp. Root101]|uniref:VOC family protein n=1 Tax=Phycicoccus sp. Root101 TaxID=1736421 RepID=UPI00070253DE|nr:VOC family protein [Phycicoccus sp. Root101]KQU64691.1 hypothetical protein ASC58_19515 [Phycicoccus sp. Root101]
MEVTWAWVFLDLPPDGFDEQLGFWQQVTRSTLSPWRGGRGEFATLLPAEGDPWVKVQRVGGAGGVHVDLEVDDVPEAAGRARDLGAVVLDDLGTLVVCRSPGGFAFCLVAAAARPRVQVRSGQPSLVDQVCLDVPTDRYAAELAFWTDLTGWAAPGTEPGESGLLPLTRPDGLPLRLLTQRLGQPDGTVTAHLDLACADRVAVTREHEGLGAQVASVHERWTVLRAPGGARYCLTDRDPGTGLLA